MLRTAVIDPQLIREAAERSRRGGMEADLWIGLLDHLLRSLNRVYALPENVDKELADALKALRAMNADLWQKIDVIVNRSNRLVPIVHEPEDRHEGMSSALNIAGSPLVDLLCTDEYSLAYPQEIVGKQCDELIKFIHDKCVDPLTYATSAHADSDIKSNRGLFSHQDTAENIAKSYLGPFFRWANSCVLVDKNIASAFYEFYIQGNTDTNWCAFMETIAFLYRTWMASNNASRDKFSVVSVAQTASDDNRHQRLVQRFGEDTGSRIANEARAIGIQLQQESSLPLDKLKVCLIHEEDAKNKSLRVLAHDRWIVNDTHKVAINCSAGLDLFHEGRTFRPCVLTYIDKLPHTRWALHRLAGRDCGIWPR